MAKIRFQFFYDIINETNLLNVGLIFFNNLWQCVFDLHLSGSSGHHQLVAVLAQTYLLDAKPGVVTVGVKTAHLNTHTLDLIHLNIKPLSCKLLTLNHFEYCAFLDDQSKTELCSEWH